MTDKHIIHKHTTSKRVAKPQEACTRTQPEPQAQQCQHKISDSELDELLGSADFAAVPDDFTDEVMQKISELPAQSTIHPSEWWQWAALIGGGIPALLQILAFIFSAWNVASLG